MKLNFVVRESKKGKDGTAPVELSIIINSQRKVITLERRCKPSNWNSAKQMAKGDKATNDFVAAIRTRMMQLEVEMLKTNTSITLDSFLDAYKNGLTKRMPTLKEVMQMVIDDYADKCNKGIVSSVTVGKYKTTLAHFNNYMPKDMCITAVTPNVINKFNDYLLGVMKNNSAVQKMKCLKTALQYAVDEGYITTSPFKCKMSIEKLEYNPLSIDDINKIKNKKITNERLNNVRWLFLFQCYTGLAYTDLATLTKEDIKDGMIIKRRKKTKVQSIIPILDVTKQILEMYDYKLPILSNQKYNAYLKEIADICGINKELHTHLARHTMATICLNNGIDINVIAKILGHSSTRITLSTYAQLLNSTVANEGNKLNNIFG